SCDSRRASISTLSLHDALPILYGHFDSRAALIAEVTRRAVEHTEAALAEVDLEGEADAALGRLLEATWRLTYRYGALVVAAEQRSEEHTSELQSRANLVCRLLL